MNIIYGHASLINLYLFMRNINTKKFINKNSLYSYSLLIKLKFSTSTFKAPGFETQNMVL